MLSFFRYIWFLIAIFTSTALQIAIAFLLPSPYNNLNIVFVFTTLAILTTESGKVVWYTFFSYLILEQLALTEFGVLLYSSTISVLLAFWLYNYLFTNHTWYSATALLVTTLTFFRLIYILIIFFSNNHYFFLTTVGLWRPFLWELSLSTLSTLIIFGLLRYFERKNFFSSVYDRK